MMEPTERILQKIIDLVDKPEKLVCFCAGFEFGKWRMTPLSRHLISWLPAAVLRPDEYPANTGDWYAAARQAAFRFFRDVDPKKRGELGELLLHIICRTEFNTHPSLAKMFYKSATNDVVKGFDIVHTKYDSDLDEIELWLGEAKFYSDGRSAARAAARSIKEHLEEGFLRQEKALIGPLLRRDTPGYDKLKWMFGDTTSLDEIVNRLVIPTLVTFDSDNAANYCGEHSSYIKGVEEEVKDLNQSFASITNLPIEVKLIYLPLGDRGGLCEDFVRRLETFQ